MLTVIICFYSQSYNYMPMPVSLQLCVIIIKHPTSNIHPSILSTSTNFHITLALTIII